MIQKMDLNTFENKNSISINKKLQINYLNNLPDDIIYLVLEYLDIEVLELIGFKFLPNKLFKNLQKNTIWNSFSNNSINYVISKKEYSVNKLKNLSNNISNIIFSEHFQKKIFLRIRPFITNVLSNYCKICNYFINPVQDLNPRNLFFISCNHYTS